jgi:hypothetical protein
MRFKIASQRLLFAEYASGCEPDSAGFTHYIESWVNFYTETCGASISLNAASTLCERAVPLLRGSLGEAYTVRREVI